MWLVALPKILLGLLQLAGAIADSLRERNLMTTAARAAVAEAMLDLNRRLDIGLKIQREKRTAEQDLDELRRGEGS
jgi:hypothetical protein